jgi:uncharacterized damage-inducible protein DinB
MNTREFFIRQFKAERPKFVSVLRALPGDKLDYRPHERSTPAGGIAWFLVLELRALLDLLQTGENRWQQPPAPASSDEIAREYETTAGEFERALSSADDAQWEREARMFVGDKLVFKRPLGEILWDFFFDAIHHRGQLTTYIRPMGGKVPAIYGPSGDAK